MKRKIRNLVKSSFRRLFIAGQKAGITILPYHFYSQIPNIRELKKEDYWKKPSSMTGVSGMDAEDQVRFLHTIAEPRPGVSLKEMYEKAVRTNGEGGGYGIIEAEVLYSFIRRKKPAKIIQVGCGVSTAIILQAADDEGYKPVIVCVEPFPTPFLSKLAADGKITLIMEKAQKVDIEHLISLKNNDLFFVDSTHTVKPGSEVNRVILEVLPRLAAGVWIHFHDIYFPFDYGRNLLTEDLFFWSESTLLHAFLVNNHSCGVEMSLSYLHYQASDKLSQSFPDYLAQKNDFGLRESEEGHFPSAIYLRTKTS